MKSYQDTPTWIQYRDILKSKFGVDLDGEPKELTTFLRGHELHLDVWEPATTPIGTLLIVHGAGGNGRIVAPLGSSLRDEGWRVIAPDLPGFGLTVPSPDFDWNYEEWPTVLAALIDEIEGPVVFLGASLGGMTALLAAQKSTANVRGVIATTLLDMSDAHIFARSARWQWLGRASLLAFRLFPKFIDRIAVPLWLVAPMKAMSADADMQSYVKTDKLLGRLRVPLRFFRTLNACTVDNLNLKYPLLLVHPGQDRWTSLKMSRPIFDRIKSRKRLVVLSGGSHLPIEPGPLKELQEEVTRFLSMALQDINT